MVGGACARVSANFVGSTKSDFISAKVVGGCLVTLVAGESSFAGRGGGATMSGADSPKGPRGSDSISKSSNFETIDWAKREPVGRRREAIGDMRVVVVVRGVDIVLEAFAWVEEREAGGGVCEDDPKSVDDVSATRVNWNAW
jgi:hypothetical protein